MKNASADSLSWARQRGDSLGKVTLGQLIALLELSSAASVAGIGGGTSQAVNYRQKLQRLVEAMGAGALTRRDGSRTRLNERGEAIAREVQLLLDQIRGSDTKENRVWSVGAGEVLLQSAVVPASAKLSASNPHWTWKVHNLRSETIVRMLREGKLHFGVLRVRELTKEMGLAGSVPFDEEELVVMAAELPKKEISARELVVSLIRDGVPLVQQGSTWSRVRELVGGVLRLADQLEDVAVRVECETHHQAAAAVRATPSWTIVPRSVARDWPDICAIPKTRKTSEFVLVNYPRVLARFSDGIKARDTLRRALGAAFRSE